jgi:transcriptional regulator with XRE-family HTH domain
MTASHGDFPKRLHIALDLAGIDAGRGRVRQLAEMYDVTRETARKWLGGLALPETERLIDMARRLGVNFEWLVTGRGSQGSFEGVRDSGASYRIETREQTRLIGLIGRLPREQRRALLVLLERLVRSE